MEKTDSLCGNVSANVSLLSYDLPFIMESVRFDFITKIGDQDNNVANTAEEKIKILSKSYDFDKSSCDIIVELPPDRKNFISVNIKTYCVGESTEPIIVDIECHGTHEKKCSLVAKNRRSGIVFSGFFDDASKDPLVPKLLYIDAVKNIFDDTVIDSNAMSAIRNQSSWLTITIYGAMIHEKLRTSSSRIETDGGVRGGGGGGGGRAPVPSPRTSRIETDGGRRYNDDNEILNKNIFFETGKNSTMRYNYVDCTRLERIGIFKITFDSEKKRDSIENKITVL